MGILMNLTLEQLVGRIAGIIAVLSVFIEITPIKFNPISSLLKFIGSRLNKDITEKLNTMEKKVDALERADIVSCRVRILMFADELRSNCRHSQEMFDQMLSDIDVYDAYCNSHPDFKNNKTVAARQRILDAYNKCMQDNDFL